MTVGTRLRCTATDCLDYFEKVNGNGSGGGHCRSPTAPQALPGYYLLQTSVLLLGAVLTGFTRNCVRALSLALSPQDRMRIYACGKTRRHLPAAAEAADKSVG